MKKTTTYLIGILFLIATNSIQASTIQPGDLLISEVLANPAAVADSNGEWFELFNASSLTIELNGLVLSDDGTNSHTITSLSPLLIAPGEYFVLGNNDDATNNGGYVTDYLYSDFSLTNSSDEIVISLGTTELVRLNYSGLPFGSAGISAELVNQVLQPIASDYSLTPTNLIFGAGDRGTPGAEGSTRLTTNAPAVPLPAAFWLFSSGCLLLARNTFTRRSCIGRTIK